MKHLHSLLESHSSSYSQWHKTPHHKVVHWGALALVSILTLTSSMVGIELTYQPEVAQAASCAAGSVARSEKPSLEKSKKAATDLALAGADLFNNFKKFKNGTALEKSQATSKMAALAGKRKQALLTAMQENPEAAFSYLILPTADRSDISKVATNCLEQQIEVSGTLQITHVHFTDDQGAFTAESVDLYTLKTVEGKNYRLHNVGFDLPESDAGSTVNIKGWKLDYEILLDMFQPGNYKVTEKATEEKHFAFIQTAEAQVPRPSDKSWNLVPNKALVVLANFTDYKDVTLTQSAAQNYFNTTANNYFKEISYNKTSLTSDVKGWVNLSISGVLPFDLATWNDLIIKQVVQALGTSVDYTSYRHLVIFAPWKYNGYGGVENSNYTVNTPNGPILMNTVLVWDRNRNNTSVPDFDLVNESSMLHELTHSFGSPHDAAVGCPAGGPALTLGSGIGCPNSEYGNANSVMGDLYHLYGHPGAESKDSYIGWLSGSNVLDLSSSAGPTTVTIEPYESVSSGVKTVKWLRKKALDPYSGSLLYGAEDAFYIEYRQPIGVDAKLGARLPGVYQGVIVSHRNNIRLSPELIDMSPSFNGNTTSIETAMPSAINPVTLQAGQTFVDPATNFKITVNSISSSGANITVTPGVLDTLGPKIKLTNPLQEFDQPVCYYPTFAKSVAGTITFTSEPTDDIGIAAVRYFIGGANVYSYNAPFSYTWSTIRHPNGWVNVLAQATDFSGANGTSCYGAMTIDNPADTVAPTVVLLNPKAGDVLGGTNVFFNSTASDSNGIVKIEYYRENQTTPFKTFDYTDYYNPGKLPYSQLEFLETIPNVPFDVSDMANGTHTVKVKAYDLWGNVADTGWQTFTRQGTAWYLGRAPELQITSPAANSTVSGTVNVTASVTQSFTPISSVKFVVDGVTLATDTTAPYSTTWNSTAGTHTITVTATDTGGNSRTVSVQVNGGGTVTPKPTISLSPTAFSFSAVSGGATPAGKSMAIANTGTATLNFTATTNQNWCHVSPASGSVAAGGSTSAAISVDAPSNVGTFTCTVTVSDAAASNSPQTASVTYSVSGVADTQVPTTPSNLSIAVNSSNQPVLSWTASTDNVGVTGYKVYRNGSLLTTTGSTALTDTSAAASNTYSYTVAAYDAAGNNSAQSAAVSVTLIAPPTPLSITSKSVTGKTSTTATIAWTTNIASTGIVYYGTSQSNLAQSAVYSIASTNHSVALSNLSPGTRYYYKIVATNQAGTSSVTSSIANFRTDRK